jgi:hypothetical protein
VFEWGTGTRANIAAYKKVVSRETQANSVAANAGPYIVFSATDSTLNKDWGKTQEFLSDVDGLSPTDVENLCNTHYNIRKKPRQTIEITPHVDPAASGRLPSYGIDYSIGDTVRVRAVYGKSVRFDVMLRVWAATFDIDSSGVERTSLTVSAAL